MQEGHKDCLKQKRKCLESNLEGKDKEEELSTIRGMINLFESAISAINNDIKEEKTQSNPDMSKISRDESKRQEFASELKKLREELEIVSAWPDPPPPSAMP